MRATRRALLLWHTYASHAALHAALHAGTCPYHPCRPAYQDVIDELLIGDEEHPPMTGFFVDSAFPDSGLTPLHWLTVENHASVAQWFIDEGQVSCPFLLTSAELCGVHVMPFYTVDAFLLTH